MLYSQTNPDNYIIDPQDLHQHQCNLCFQLTLSMRKCTGPCQKNICIFCLRRMDQWNKCYFCGIDMELEAAEIPPIRYRCPSKDQKCLIELRSQHDLLSHACQCPYLSQSTRLQFKYKVGNLCECGEQLRFDDESACHECGLDGSGSLCSKCQVGYCTRCRKPPVSRGFCMRGHELESVVLERGDEVICDLCEIPIHALKSREIFSDDGCDFDICFICKQTLPQHPPEEFQPDQSSSQDDYSSYSDDDQEDEEDEEEEEADEQDQHQQEDGEEQSEEEEEEENENEGEQVGEGGSQDEWVSDEDDN